MRNDMLQKRLNLELDRPKIPEDKLSMGSTNDKYAVILDDGRTVVFISDKSKEPAIRLKYQMMKDKKYSIRSPREKA